MSHFNTLISAGVIATILAGLISTIVWISTPLEEMMTSRFTTFFIAAIFGILFSYLMPDEKEETGAVENVS